MASEFSVTGPTVSLVVAVDRYEYPEERCGHDANWLTGSVRLEARRQAGSFSAHQNVALSTAELAAFRDDLRELLAALTGEASFHHLEDELDCTVRLVKGRGTLELAEREHVGPELRVTEAETDQSYLSTTLAELDSWSTPFRSG